MNAPANEPKPEISEEEDKPFEHTADLESEIPQKDVDEIEHRLKVAKGWQSIVLKNEGFGLLIFCIVLATGAYIADCILINIGMKSSSLMTGFFELLKFIISILLGFVFAKASET